MGILSDLAYEYKGTGFSIVGLSADVEGGSAAVADAKALFKTAGGKFTNLTYSRSVANTILSGVRSVPTTKFYDSNGHLLATIYGANDKQEWINIIETVIHEKA